VMVVGDGINLMVALIIKNKSNFILFIQ
jgi:hypothetical protein